MEDETCGWGERKQDLIWAAFGKGDGTERKAPLSNANTSSNHQSNNNTDEHF